MDKTTACQQFMESAVVLFDAVEIDALLLRLDHGRYDWTRPHVLLLKGLLMSARAVRVAE